MTKRKKQPNKAAQTTTKRRQPQPTAKTDVKSARRSINAILALIIVAGLAYLLLFPDEPPKPTVEPAFGGPPPVLTFETEPDGARVARMDVQKLSDWCESVGLPGAPPIDLTEPPVAEAVMAALREAATARTAQSYAQVGRICYAVESRQYAKRYFALAAEQDPSDFRWPYLVGCMCQAMGQSDEANAALATVLRLNDEYAMTYARLGQLRLEAGRLDEAETYLRRFLLLRPEDWLGRVGLGRVALERGDYEAALTMLRSAADQAPDDFQTHYYLGKTYAALGRNELAEQHFDRLRTLSTGLWLDARDPLLLEAKTSIDSSTGLVEEIERLKDSRDWPRLAGLVEQIVRRRPGDTIMSGNLASLYRAQKRFADAHAVLDRALKLKPGSARLHATRAEIYLTEGKYDQARDAAEAAAEIDRALPGAYNVLGRALFSLNLQGEAEIAMRRAVELDPTDAGKVFVLGEIYRLGGKSSDAIDAYERTLKLAPAHELARQRLALLQRDR